MSRKEDGWPGEGGAGGKRALSFFGDKNSVFTVTVLQGP